MAQDVKKGVSKAIRTNTIPLIAIMTAVTTVVAMFVKVPTPGKGYLNLSDTMIYFSAYAFVIDGVQALLVGFLARRFEPVSIIVGSVAAGAWKVFGYFIAGWILSGMGPALVDIPGNCLQAAVGLVVGFALFSAVRKAYPPLVRLGGLGVKASE